MSKIPGIKKLPDGRYLVRITVGYRDGKPIRRKRTCISHAEAKRAIIELQSEFDSEDTTKTPTTLGEFSHQWMTDDVERTCKVNTISNYRQQLNKHILPTLGGVQLSELTPSIVNQFASSLEKSEVPTPTQIYVLRVLSQLCKRAMHLELITKNPVDAVRRPKHRPAEITPFTQSEAKKILDHTSGQPSGLIYCLGLCQGMRIGEILGLHWDDVTDDTITIRRSYSYKGGKLTNAKTTSSHRTIEMASRTRHEVNERRKLALVEGNASHPYVMAGRPHRPINYYHWRVGEWVPLLKELDLEHRGFHHTRHTYATLALSEGVPVTVVSKMLGHANPAITMSIYAHALEEHQGKATSAINRLFG